MQSAQVITVKVHVRREMKYADFRCRSCKSLQALRPSTSFVQPFT
jgi:hypothetical protein